ncbi:MAG: hypothetical protein M9894_23970 [Planctomycetes bacterium]|nr:hypothetical protein [Planctomycetota bacterium]
MRLSLAFVACALLGLGGCHAPELTFSGEPREVRSSSLRVVTDLPPAEAERAQAWLEGVLGGMCERWGLPRPDASAPLSCYLFGSPEDFARFRDYDALLRGGHARQAGTCVGFYCAGCDAFATSPALAREAPLLDDPSSWRPLEHVLAHELNHHLLDRHGARGTPAWLSEGVAETEGLRAWAARDGGAPGAPSQVYRALTLSALALRGLYGEHVFVDLHDRGLAAVTWGHEYPLDLALCLTLEDLDPALLRRLATGGRLPRRWAPARLDRAARERARLLSGLSPGLARADARAWPAAARRSAPVGRARCIAAAAPAPPATPRGGSLAGRRPRATRRAAFGALALTAHGASPAAVRARLAGTRRAVWHLAEAVNELLSSDGHGHAALGDLELWLLGNLERRALVALRGRDGAS